MMPMFAKGLKPPKPGLEAFMSGARGLLANCWPAFRLAGTCAAAGGAVESGNSISAWNGDREGMQLTFRLLCASY